MIRSRIIREIKILVAYHELFKLLCNKNEHCELLELRIVTVNTVLGRSLTLVIGQEQWYCMIIGTPEMIARNGLSTQQTWTQSEFLNKLHWALNGEKNERSASKRGSEKEGCLARKRQIAK